MQKIYAFGNEHIKGDEIAKVLAKEIKKYRNFEFVIAESPTEILREKEEIWILDVAKGISEVKLIQNPENLELSPHLTCHDLDLGFYLKLLTQSGSIKKINIIALPYGEINTKKLKKNILEILSN